MDHYSRTIIYRTSRRFAIAYYSGLCKREIDFTTFCTLLLVHCDQSYGLVSILSLKDKGICAFLNAQRDCDEIFRIHSEFFLPNGIVETLLNGPTTILHHSRFEVRLDDLQIASDGDDPTQNTLVSPILLKICWWCLLPCSINMLKCCRLKWNETSCCLPQMPETLFELGLDFAS
jgi:hypothetical protein